MTNQFKEELENGCKKLNIILSDRQLFQFFRYYELLLETNKVMNLTAITEEKEVIEKHFVDSLLLVRVLDQMNENSGKKEPIKERFSKGTCIDVGTGAGFPGMPLAILCPQTEFVLLDALRKRIDFLNEVITELGLTNVTAVHARAEDYARDNRGTFDLAVSRAVADLRVLSELALPMVKVGGAFLAMKAEDCTEEVEAAANARTVLGAPDAEVLHYTVPFDEVSRAIVRLQKTQETPEKYPRRFKKIQTSPL